MVSALPLLLHADYRVCLTLASLAVAVAELDFQSVMLGLKKILKKIMAPDMEDYNQRLRVVCNVFLFKY